MQISKISSSSNNVSFGKIENKNTTKPTTINQKEICSTDTAKALAATNGIKAKNRYITEEINIYGENKNATPEHLEKLDEITTVAMYASEKGYAMAEKANDLFNKAESVRSDCDTVLAAAQATGFPPGLNIEATEYDGTWTFNKNQGKFKGEAYIEGQRQNAEINFSTNTNELQSLKYKDEETGKTNVVKFKNDNIVSILTGEIIAKNGTKSYDEAFGFNPNGTIANYTQSLTITPDKKTTKELIIYNNDERATQYLTNIEYSQKTKTTKCNKHMELIDYGQASKYNENVSISPTKKQSTDVSYNIEYDLDKPISFTKRTKIV